MFDQDAALQNEPSAVKLATHAALASAKLAAALSGEDVDEIGMTIAYLKRALKAITLSMDAAAALLRETRISATQHAVLVQRLFQVRDGIITLIGEYRGEWRRRFGSRRLSGLNELNRPASVQSCKRKRLWPTRCLRTGAGKTVPEGDSGAFDELAGRSNPSFWNDL